MAHGLAGSLLRESPRREMPLTRFRLLCQIALLASSLQDLTVVRWGAIRTPGDQELFDRFEYHAIELESSGYLLMFEDVCSRLIQDPAIRDRHVEQRFSCLRNISRPYWSHSSKLVWPNQCMASGRPSAWKNLGAASREIVATST
jgi:hypothetical protein